MTTGTLYLLPNRISETASIDTLPATTQAVARGCTRFLAENAKTARAYLKALNHPLPIQSLEIIEIGHEPDPSKIDEWLAPVLTGTDTCVVSESGCPGVADPGADIVRSAQQKNIEVIPLTGPCSMLMALMASGLNGQRFRFVGYLPLKEPERSQAIVALQSASRSGETQLFIETPYRNTKVFEDLLAACDPNTWLTVAIDVTGQTQSVRTRTIAQWKTEAIENLPKMPTVFALSANPKTIVHGSIGKTSAQSKPSHHVRKHMAKKAFTKR